MHEERELHYFVSHAVRSAELCALPPVCRPQMHATGAPAKLEGCNGLSLVIEKLPYADYNNIWIIPIAHTLLFGLVASFVSHIFRPVNSDKEDAVHGPRVQVEPPVPTAMRNIIEQRGKDLFVPSEFGRKYKSVLQYRGSYTMEDWLHFVLAFSPYLFGPGVLSPLLEKMWGHLVKAVEHYFHAVAGSTYTDAGSQEAADALLSYAKLVEQHFGWNMCTFNLHIAVCR